MVRKALIFSLAVLTLVLGGCNWRLDIKSPNSESVVSRMVNNLSETKSFVFAGDFSLVGSSSVALFSGLTDLKIKFNGESNISSVEGMQYGVELTLAGTAQEGFTEVGMELRSFPDNDYFRINHLTLPLSLPFTLSTDQRWYRIKSASKDQSDFIGGVDKLSDTKLKELRNLVSKNNFFEVEEELDDQTVNGSRAFHYKVRVDSVALEEFLYSWLLITDSDNLDKVSDWVAMLKTYDYEIFINKHNFNLAKIKISGWYLDTKNQRLEFTTSINLDSFNGTVDIPRPNDVEDFNLRSLLGV